MRGWGDWLGRRKQNGAAAWDGAEPRRLFDALPAGIRARLPRGLLALTGRLDGTWAEIEAFFGAHQLGLYETLERVRRDRLSLARFGDGELDLARRDFTWIAYQHGSPQIQAELSAILRGEGYEGVPLLVCIPGITVAYYRRYWAKYWLLVKPMLNPAAVYGNTSVSREGLFSLDAERGRLAWRAIWDGQDVCYVVGQGSRFDPIEALFGGVASHRTIYSLPKNAYEDVGRLVDEIVASVPRETLILMALGPAATVLAARLARLGYWALDIGHITSAYQTVALGAPRPETMPVVKPK